MYQYTVTFLGGSQIKVFADSPKEAYNKAETSYKGLEVIRVTYKRTL